ncbi:Uncharacterised protein [Vibrio cholerae]|nr:Uncharacterised protein [Vibrio cholerae]
MRCSRLGAVFVVATSTLGMRWVLFQLFIVAIIAGIGTGVFKRALTSATEGSLPCCCRLLRISSSS